MKSIRTSLLLVVLGMVLVGCGSIESGQVGVRTAWNGEVQAQEESTGFYTAFISSVDAVSVKEIAVPINNLQPKAKDNLSMQDLDLEVYYRINPAQAAELRIKYANRDAAAEDGGNAVVLPVYHLVQATATDAVYSVVPQYDSLELHLHREALAGRVHRLIQKQLDKSDPGAIQVTKVVVKNAQTDRAIENSIKQAVAKNKELEAKKIELEIAEKQSEINRMLSESLTPEILKQRELDVMMAAIESGQIKPVILMGGGGAQPLINLK